MQKYGAVNTRCTVTGENTLRTMTLWSSQELLEANVDTIRGLVYRDFELPHPAQLLGEKMVDLKVNKDGNFRTAKITYDMFMNKPTKPRTGLSKDAAKQLAPILPAI